MLTIKEHPPSTYLQQIIFSIFHIFTLCGTYQMCCLFLCFCFVFFPMGVVLAKLFISNKARLVAKVGWRLPGSREHLGASGSWCSVTLGIPPSLHLLYPAGCDANRDVKEGEPSALGADFFDQYFNHTKKKCIREM